MARPTDLKKFIGKTVGKIKILKANGIKNGRMVVSCRCLRCERIFKVHFNNIRRKNYKSCGCLNHPSFNQSKTWKGYGEIGSTYFTIIKRGAIKRNLEFKITIKQIWKLFLKQKRKCKFSGKKLTFSKSNDIVSKTASLDRINSSKGYTVDNVQWIHKKINFMKQNMPDKEFLNWIKIIYKFRCK